MAEKQGDYYTIKRVLDILDILHKQTDETHYMTQAQLLEQLKLREHDCCEKTLTNTLKTLLNAVNPLDDLDGTIQEGYGIEDYRIVVKGLQDKIKARELGLIKEARKKLQIRGMRLNHDFSYRDVDRLVEAVLFMKNMSDEERTYLIEKLQMLVSDYYPQNSVYFSPITKKLNTKLTSVYENARIDESVVRENIRILTEAIEKNGRGCKISFHFGGYNKDSEMEYTAYANGELKEYIADPYYIVLYGGKYYLICSAFDYNTVSIFRIDLMKDIHLDVRKSLTSDKPGIVNRTRKDKIKGLPSYWNSEIASKFISEHLFMFYGAPRKIDIKIKTNRYTLLHDYFGEHYRFKKHLENDWDLVQVECVPEALKKWAMLNSEVVEIMDDGLRKEMVEECRELMRRYEDGE